MKGAVIGIVTGILGLFLFFLLSFIQLKDGTVDIYLLDTYYVISYLIALLYLAVILGVFFSFGGLLQTRFRDKRFWLALFISCTIAVLVFWMHK